MLHMALHVRLPGEHLPTLWAGEGPIVAGPGVLWRWGLLLLLIALPLLGGVATPPLLGRGLGGLCCVRWRLQAGRTRDHGVPGPICALCLCLLRQHLDEPDLRKLEVLAAQWAPGPAWPGSRVLALNMGQEALIVSGSNTAAMLQHYSPPDFFTECTLHEAE